MSTEHQPNKPEYRLGIACKVSPKEAIKMAKFALRSDGSDSLSGIDVEYSLWSIAIRKRAAQPHLGGLPVRQAYEKESRLITPTPVVGRFVVSTIKFTPYDSESGAPSLGRISFDGSLSEIGLTDGPLISALAQYHPELIDGFESTIHGEGAVHPVRPIRFGSLATPPSRFDPVDSLVERASQNS